MIDTYSRYIVGAHVHGSEPGQLAVKMMKEIFGVYGILMLTRSYSRPRDSNDNPYSEALFKAMKYGPQFPQRFASLSEARTFITEFVAWHNHDHQRSGIGLHTPANVHFGLAEQVAARRSQTLVAARARHPERFGRFWDPLILVLSEATWINNPQDRAVQAA